MLLNTRVSASDVLCMYSKPTALSVRPGLVDVVLLGLGTLNIVCTNWSSMDVGHLLPSTTRAGDHDFCSPHECTYHRPFVLEVMV